MFSCVREEHSRYIAALISFDNDSPLGEKRGGKGKRGERIKKNEEKKKEKNKNNFSRK